MFTAHAWQGEPASLTLGNKSHAIPTTVIIPQSQRSTCEATRTSNPPIYHYNGNRGREGGPRDTHSLHGGGFLPIWQPQWEVSLSSAL